MWKPIMCRTYFSRFPQQNTVQPLNNSLPLIKCESSSVGKLPTTILVKMYYPRLVCDWYYQQKINDIPSLETKPIILFLVKLNLKFIFYRECKYSMLRVKHWGFYVSNHAILSGFFLALKIRATTYLTSQNPTSTKLMSLSPVKRPIVPPKIWNVD